MFHIYLGASTDSFQLLYHWRCRTWKPRRRGNEFCTFWTKNSWGNTKMSSNSEYIYVYLPTELSSTEWRHDWSISVQCSLFKNDIWSFGRYWVSLCLLNGNVALVVSYYVYIGSSKVWECIIGFMWFTINNPCTWAQPSLLGSYWL